MFPDRLLDTGERRQVSVLFSDLVGSTALAGRMDPEDLREIISAYQKCVAETVRRFGGFVAKYQRRAYGLRNEDYLRLKILTCMLPEL